MNFVLARAIDRPKDKERIQLASYHMLEFACVLFLLTALKYIAVFLRKLDFSVRGWRPDTLMLLCHGAADVYSLKRGVPS